MKSLLILVEGQTEKEFIDDVLMPYLWQQHQIVSTPTIIKTRINKQGENNKGGFVKYAKTRKEILRLIHNSKGLVTTMFDFYQLGDDYPGVSEIKSSMDSIEKVNLIENRWKEDIDHLRFLPNLQLHEFESILFCDIAPWEMLFDDESAIKKIEAIINQYDNPEEINDSPQTAPSKRIENIFEDYNKPAYGALIASQIGMPIISQKCPHFKSWLSRIIDRFQPISKKQ